jgi:DNA-binding MarR family transcriptional regulator
MVTRAVTQLYDEALRPSGLRVTQFSILASIARAGAATRRP